MNIKKNAISSLLFQLATIVQGLVLPRVILEAFGSEVNGLISSITQFLSFISLLEGGLGAVVLAELYKPIEDRNDEKIQGILKACQSFFSKLAGVFLLYTVLLALLYPHFVDTVLTNEFIITLVFILSITTVAQYLFSITYRLLLQAEQKVYIVNFISAITVLINTVSAVIIVKIFPSIHMVKLWSGIIYLIQPLVYRIFVEKKFLKSTIRHSAGKLALKNRWSGFAQNLAYFVNVNTDVVLITLFMPLEYVSVYYVHLLVINALKGIVLSITNSYQSALGKYIAMGDDVQLRTKFAKFEEIFWLAGMILFFCCILLINPFIQIYTKGIHDAEYSQPLFAFMIVLANMLCVIREPYRILILAGGRFKETNFGSFGEAAINLGLSLILIRNYGLVGVAIGTLVAIIFRFCYLVWYLHRDLLKKSYVSLAPYITTFVLSLLLNLAIYLWWPLQLENIFQFLLAGCIVLGLESAFCIAVYWIVRKLFPRIQQK